MSINSAEVGHRRAQQVTLAAGVASRRLSSVVDHVANKLLQWQAATTEEEEERWRPSDSELERLRLRYLEYQALEDAGHFESRIGPSIY